jgi:SAM-dependent methyltransferase
MTSARMATASSCLDLQTGGGEVLAWSLGHLAPTQRPTRLAATESWAPNAALARSRLAPFGAAVHQVDDEATFPFAADGFELVTSRHPVSTNWPEIARVLTPGGTFLSQQVGAGTNRELTEWMMGPQPDRDRRSAQGALASAETAGLTVVDLRAETLAVTFNDVAAVVHFLRKVLWTVPGFTVDGYRDRLSALHDHISRHGPFVSHAQRYLIEVRKGLMTA